MTEAKKQEMYRTLVDLGTQEAVDLLLSFHGTQLLGDDFYDFLVDEGVIEEEPEEDEDEEDEEGGEDE